MTRSVLTLALLIASLMLPLQASAEKKLTIINQRDAFPIWKVYITPAGQDSWGTDQLGDKSIAAGQSHTWTIPWDGCYVDVKAETFTGISVERRNVDVCGGFRWTIDDGAAKKQDKSLTIINRREAFPIWKVYITPAGQDTWGEDQLGDKSIAAGKSHKWNIPWDGCFVDVKAETFTGLSVERRNVDICGGFEWVVNDETQNQQSKSLTIINRREDFPIWKVYITPAGQDSWGTDQLGDKSIAAGKSHKWNIPWDGCFVDVKAETFTGLSTERRNVNVCGGFEWTVYDDNPKN